MAWLLWWLLLWLLACWHKDPKVTSGRHSFVLSGALAVRLVEASALWDPRNLELLRKDAQTVLVGHWEWQWVRLILILPPISAPMFNTNRTSFYPSFISEGWVLLKINLVNIFIINLLLLATSHQLRDSKTNPKLSHFIWISFYPLLLLIPPLYSLPFIQESFLMSICALFPTLWAPKWQSSCTLLSS